MPHRVDEMLRAQVLKALRRYRKADLAEQAAVTWPTVQVRIRSGTNPVRAVRDFIDDSLGRLSINFAFESQQLLKDRYVRGMPVSKVCLIYAISERDCFRKCEHGIDELTLIIRDLNCVIVPFQAPARSSLLDFKEQAITALMGKDITLTQHVLGQYPYPQAMEQLVRHLRSYPKFESSL